MLQLFMTHATGCSVSKDYMIPLYNMLEKDIKSDEGEISAARENGGGQHVTALTVWGRFLKRTVLYLIVFTQKRRHLQTSPELCQRVGGGGVTFT